MPQSGHVQSIQIFGIKNSQATRAAERFFKERRITVHMVDLKQKSMAPAELKRFSDRFGLQALVDTQCKAYEDAGMKYLRMTDAELLGRMERDPKLLKLPLVRAGNKLSIGQDEDAWKLMAASAAGA